MVMREARDNAVEIGIVRHWLGDRIRNYPDRPMTQRGASTVIRIMIAATIATGTIGLALSGVFK